MRRPLPRQPKHNRRSNRNPTQLRRRKSHSRNPAPGGIKCPGPDPSLPRHPRTHDHSPPPRQLLRKDVGLQQPPAIPHPLLADLAAHRIAHLRNLPKGPSLVRRRLPRSQRNAQTPHRSHRRAPHSLQHRPLQRENSRSQRNHGRPHRSLRNLRPHRENERHRRSRAGKTATPSRATSQPTASPPRLS